MRIHTAATETCPASLPAARLDRDWFGDPVDPPVRFAFGTDPSWFHFFAGRQSPPRVHPAAVPGGFQAELWRHDVAEFFLLDPSSGRYLEFNLAPNGAWWACEFRGPRVAIDPAGCRIPGVSTEAGGGPHEWRVTASVPLAFLRDRFAFGPASRLDATFIVDSPAQRFLCASQPSPGDPDFHRPGAWPAVELSAL